MFILTVTHTLNTHAHKYKLTDTHIHIASCGESLGCTVAAKYTVLGKSGGICAINLTVLLVSINHQSREPDYRALT